ncbi:MAG: nucleoside-diphosphate sugar epimerase/dehydratase [Acidimicrobiales bacterium]
MVDRMRQGVRRAETALWRVAQAADRRRRVFELGVDIVSWTFAVWVALWWRFEFTLGEWPLHRVWGLIGIAVISQVAIGGAFGLYRGRWRFGSFDEAAALLRTVLSATGIVAVVNLVVPDRLAPTSVAAGGGALALLLTGGLRYTWRLFRERQLRPDHTRAKRVLVFGAGEGGISLVTQLLRNPDSPLIPVGFLDDNADKRHLEVRGVKVLGTRYDIAEVARRLHVDHLVVAIPSANSTLLRKLAQVAVDVGLDVSVLPPVEEFLEGHRPSAADIRPLDIRDLLGRHEVQLDVSQIADYVRGKRVLVTGAGGSIGSELCRQLDKFAPSELVMLDRDESALHAVELSLHGRALLDRRNLVVADIRDAERVAEVFSEHRPNVVFHAAALKHLPLLEMYPEEGVKTNVYGTLNVLSGASGVGVDRFVNVSTDKAADPTSVLGWTKQIAEQLTAAYGEDQSGTYLSVRFGNVLGSRGSVLEAFRSQVASGGPITVTHPDVTRFFMTPEEAAQLVIQAGAVGRDGEALVLDMGEPVKILDVARQLAAQADRPIEIVFTGLRPGEKMHEVLFGLGEIDQRPAHPLISHVPVEPVPLKGFEERVMAQLSVHRNANPLVDDDIRRFG